MRSPCVVVLALVVGSPFTFAQDTGGRIEGRLAASDTTPVAGATVVAEGPALMAARATISDDEGRFRLVALPVGTYVLHIDHPAFESAILGDVTIRLGGTTALPALRLKPKSTFEENVEVTARPVTIDPVSTEVGGTLSSSYYENVPVERNYQSIAALLPHVGVSYLGDDTNFAGSTGQENRYFIDGVDVTDPYRGIGGTSLPHDFVEEVEVRIGGYEAEYRSALGGIVNVVTPSGGERWAGKVFGYYAGDQFSGEALQGVTQLAMRDYQQYDAGVSFSGPIVRERLRCFVAYNPAFERSQREVPGTGYHTDDATVHRFAGKLTWQATPLHTLALTAVADPATRDAVGDTFVVFGTPISFENPDPLLRHIETGGNTVSVRGTHVWTPRLLLETEISRLTRKEVNEPSTDRGRQEPLFIDYPTGVWSGGSPIDVDVRSAQWTLGAKATWSRGAHELKAGLEYRENEAEVHLFSRKYARLAEGSYNEIVFWQNGSVHHRLPSAFVQDSWRIGEGLTLNAGLRWDGLSIVGSDGRVAQTIDGQWQPRVGFVYRPGAGDTQRVYGSAARYFQELMTQSPTLYHIEDSFQAVYLYDQDPTLDPPPLAQFEVPGYIRPAVDGLRGQGFDELTLGYERRIASRHRLGARGVYRTLRDAIEDATVGESFEAFWGNPGRGMLAEYPRPTREYRALEITFQRDGGTRLGYLLSYVWSQTRGNFPGLFDSDRMNPFANSNQQYDFLEQLVNADGELPNDRTHVFKASGFYRFDFGLNVGTSMVWESGTPLSEMGATVWGPTWYTFVQPRGSEGRTSSLFDLNVRLDYRFGRPGNSRWHPRLIVDVFHLFSEREPVDVDQVHYFNADDSGNPINPNPTYGQPTRYFPPTTVRLGLEVSF